MKRTSGALRAAKYNIFDEEAFVAGVKWSDECWVKAIEKMQKHYSKPELEDIMHDAYLACKRIREEVLGK